MIWEMSLPKRRHHQGLPLHCSSPPT
jgi:hypothetical protein